MKAPVCTYNKEKAQVGALNSSIIYINIAEVRNAYAACMDTERIEDSSVADLKEMLGRLGGWPVLEGDSWEEEVSYHWSAAVT